jgi:hypothetical protein
MAEEVLVSSLSPALIEAGRSFVARLQDARFPVSGGLWLLLPEDSTWRLFVISEAADVKRPIKLYESVLKHAPNSAYPFWPSIIRVLSPRDSFAMALREALRSSGDDGSEEGEAWISISTSDVAHAYVYKRW